MSDSEVTRTMAEDGKVKTFNVVFEIEARAVGKMRNEVRGQMVSPVLDEVFEMATDEGAAHGGDMTAPPDAKSRESIEIRTMVLYPQK